MSSFKKTYLLVTCLAIWINSQSISIQAKGIDFFTGKLEEAHSQAKNQKKFLFIHAYVEDYQPCQNMERNIFTHQTVATYYNEHFVNYKVNVNSPIGKRFKEQHKVLLVPSLLYFDLSGNLLYETCGEFTSEELVTIGEKVLRKTKVSLDAMIRQFDSGYKNPTFLYDLSYELKRQGRPYRKVADEYITQKKLYKANFEHLQDIQFIYDFSDNVYGKAMDILLKNKTFFQEKYGIEHINRKITEAIKSSADAATINKNTKLFERSKKVLLAANLTNQRELEIDIVLHYQKQQMKKADFIHFFREQVDGYEGNDGRWLYDKTRQLLLLSTTEHDFVLSKKWLESSISLLPNYSTYELYINTLCKLSEYNKAQKEASKAIEVAKKQQVDYTGMQLFLKDLVGKQARYAKKTIDL